MAKKKGKTRKMLNKMNGTSNLEVKFAELLTEMGVKFEQHFVFGKSRQLKPLSLAPHPYCVKFPLSFLAKKSPSSQKGFPVYICCIYKLSINF